MRIVNCTTYNPSLVWKRLTIPFFPGMTMNGEYDRLNTLGWKENPKKNAGIFSILFYRWVGEIVAIGNNSQVS